MAKQKITGSDLFGNDVDVYFEKFNTNAKEAAEHIKELKKQIKGLNTAMKGNGGLIKLQSKINEELKEYNKLLKKSGKLEKKHGQNIDQNKKGLKGYANAQKQVRVSTARLGGSIRSLLGAAGFAGLAYSVIQVGRSIFDNSKKLDSMNLALEKVTKSTYEFAESKRFLSQMSERLGIDILKTAKSYTTFRAAADQSNLTMGETTEIFESFADVGANLALTSSEMGSIFLALEQMLSKGKVSTEELRRQLGEKLPGAMGIMADALEVSTGELDKMLRQGKVLSETALPKFAKQVRKVYGVDLKKSVDTLQASQTRLNNAWIRFIELLNNDGNGVSMVFKGAIEALTKMIELGTEFAGIMGERGPGSWHNVMTEALENTLDTIVMILDGVGRFSALIANITPPGWIVKLATGDSVYDKFFGKDGEGGLYAGLDEMKKQIAFERKHRAEAEASREEQKRRVMLVTELQRQTAILNTKMGEEIVQQLNLVELSKLSNDELKAKIEFLNKQNLSIDKQRQAIEDLAIAHEKELKARQAKGLSVTVEEIEAETKKNHATWTIYYENLDRLLRDKVKDLEENAAKLKEQILLFPDDKTAQEELAKIEKQIVAFYNRIGSKVQPMDTGRLEGAHARLPGTPPPGSGGEEAPSLFGTTLSGDEEDTWEKRLTFARDFMGQINEIENQVYEARLMRLENEEKAIENKYHRLNRLAEGDQELQEKLAIRQEEEEKKVEKKRKKIEYDQAKAKKRQALIDIAINTAIAVSKVWGQTGIFGLAAQIPVIAMGVVQAAVVASQALPEYADGTDFHPGGPAILGDGGKEELAFTPDGKTILTAATPEIHDLPKGTKVVADAKQYIQEQVIKSIIMTDQKLDEIVVDKITDAVRKGFRGVQMNNNVTVKNSADYLSYRNRLLN